MNSLASASLASRASAQRSTGRSAHFDKLNASHRSTGRLQQAA